MRCRDGVTNNNLDEIVSSVGLVFSVWPVVCSMTWYSRTTAKTGLFLTGKYRLRGGRPRTVLASIIVTVRLAIALVPCVHTGIHVLQRTVACRSRRLQV
eukprot:10666865-Heterocapsa_arctica.AAC.1